MLVLLDASILMFMAGKPSKFLDDLQAQIGETILAVPSPVLGELKGLSKIKGRRAREAALGLEYAQNLKSLDFDGDADTALLQIAQEHDALVATMDRELMRELKVRHVKVATVKDNHLILQGAFF